MPDPLRIEPHPESERTYSELREQYRAQNLARIRALLTDYRIHGVKMKLMGKPLALNDDVIYWEDGQEKSAPAGSPKGRAVQLLAALDAPVTQNFGLDDVPLYLRRELADLAAECGLFDQVTWADDSGAVDHDGPPAPIPVEDMTEQEQLNYVDRAIEESKREI